jgi:deoxyribonuclease-4
MRIGFHVSILGSIDEAVDRATEIGINTFQIFTRNPRGWQFKPLDTEEIDLFKEKLSRDDIEPVIVHMPYLPNLASTRREIYALSIKSLTTELNRCDELDVPFLVTHLGSHLGSGKAIGLKRITEAINTSLSEAEGSTKILLENTAGTRNSMGSTFEDIRRVVDGVTFDRRIGVCFDTCHAFAAGYDLRSSEAVGNVLAVFDAVLGLERLKLVHLNDSVGDFRSRIDRHEHIGLGRIGDKGFKAVLGSAFGRCPLILETPVDERRSDAGNLMKVMELAET